MAYSMSAWALSLYVALCFFGSSAEVNDTGDANMSDPDVYSSSWAGGMRNITTELTDPIAPGDRTIRLADITGIQIGDELTVTDGSISETKIIVAISPGRRLDSEGRQLATAGTVTVDTAFQNSFAAGAQVQVTGGETVASAGSDPVVWFRGESKEFWLPVGKLTPVIHTRHLNMLASTFVGSPREQWIDRVVITNADGFRFADIRIKRNIKDFNRSRATPNGFESIDLTIGMAHTPLKTMPLVKKGGSSAHQRMDVSVSVHPLNKVFNWLPWHVDQNYIGKAHREAVIINSPDARFLIISSPATEYAGDFSYLSVQYAHLDIHVLDMEHKQSVRGLLPELWGIQKMSNRTMELCTPPWSSKGAPIEHRSVDVDAQWNRAFQV